MSKSGVVSDSGICSEVGERLVTSDGVEGSEGSSLGKVGKGVGEGSGVNAGTTLESGVDKAKSGLVRMRSGFVREVGSGVGGEVSGGSEVASGFKAGWGVSSGLQSEVSAGPGGPGEAEGPGDGVGGAVLVAAGRGGRRSGHGFLGEPVSPWTLGVGGLPGLLVVPAPRVSPSLPAVGVPSARPLPDGVSHVQGSL